MSNYASQQSELKYNNPENAAIISSGDSVLDPDDLPQYEMQRVTQFEQSLPSGVRTFGNIGNDEPQASQTTSKGKGRANPIYNPPISPQGVPQDVDLNFDDESQEDDIYEDELSLEHDEIYLELQDDHVQQLIERFYGLMSLLNVTEQAVSRGSIRCPHCQRRIGIRSRRTYNFPEYLSTFRAASSTSGPSAAPGATSSSSNRHDRPPPREASAPATPPVYTPTASSSSKTSHRQRAPKTSASVPLPPITPEQQHRSTPPPPATPVSPSPSTRIPRALPPKPALPLLTITPSTPATSDAIFTSPTASLPVPHDDLTRPVTPTQPRRYGTGSSRPTMAGTARPLGGRAPGTGATSPLRSPTDPPVLPMIRRLEPWEPLEPLRGPPDSLPVPRHPLRTSVSLNALTEPKPRYF